MPILDWIPVCACTHTHITHTQESCARARTHTHTHTHDLQLPQWFWFLLIFNPPHLPTLDWNPARAHTHTHTTCSNLNGFVSFSHPILSSWHSHSHTHTHTHTHTHNSQLSQWLFPSYIQSSPAEIVPSLLLSLPNPSLALCKIVHELTSICFWKKKIFIDLYQCSSELSTKKLSEKFIMHRRQLPNI